MKLSFIAIVLFACAPLFADPAIVSAKSGLNIREKPDTKSKVLMTVVTGGEVEVEEVLSKSENIQGKQANWMKVTYQDPSGGPSVSGFAFGGFLFREPGKHPVELREDFIQAQYGIVVTHQGTDDTHWSVSLKLQSGKVVTLWKNNGSSDGGSGGYYVADYNPAAGFISFRQKDTPDYALVDYTTGKIHRLQYDVPSFNAAGTAYFESANGGMFGFHMDVYEIGSGRVPRNVFAMHEEDLPSWDEFRAAWKDANTIECRYVHGGAKRGFLIKKTGGSWVRLADCSVDALTGVCK